MPLSARDQPHGALAWSSSSPTKRNSKSIAPLHRRNASSSDGIATSQSLPRYLGGKSHDKMKKNEPIWRSMSKQARRKPRLALLVLIGLIALCLLSNRYFRGELAISVLDTASGDRQLAVSEEHAARKHMLDLDPRPVARKPSGRPDEKYMAYFPHSVSLLCVRAQSTLLLFSSRLNQGYHNQRISLENALTVARMLDRTLLIPPVWLGHSIPYIAFDKMYHRVLEARKDGLEHCKDVEAPAPIPHECLGGYWDYTIVSWDFLVDLERVARVQPVVERWDMSYKWLADNLNLDVSKDMVKVKDSLLYQYRLYDNESDVTPLDKFHERLDIPKLKADYANAKLLHFGTLFGTTRLRLVNKDNYAARSLARSSMVFKNEYLDKVSNTIRDRLGGNMSYIGVHLRLGDGVFRDNAAHNAKRIFDDLVEKKLGLDIPTLAKINAGETVLETAKPLIHKRMEQSTGFAIRNDDENTTSTDGTTAAPPKKKKVDPHLDLPPLLRVSTRSESPLHSSLSCRKPLYTAESLLALNTPIFLATDSSIPDKDTSLKLFFDTFPCIFTFADFSASSPTPINNEPIEAFQELDRLRNKEDGVPLAGFFYPLIDAMVAAKGRDMLGTPGVSCYSRFRIFSRAPQAEVLISLPEYIQSIRGGCFTSCLS